MGKLGSVDRVAFAVFVVGMSILVGATRCTPSTRQEAKTVSLAVLPLEQLGCAVVRLERPSADIQRACELADEGRLLVEDLQAAAAREREAGVEDAALH